MAKTTTEATTETMIGTDTERTPRTIKLALIYGSVRDGRFCDQVANWADGRIRQTGAFSVDPIDPAEFGLSHHHLDASSIADLKLRLGHADGFVVVTPEYNHSYPGALKLLIDAAYSEWQAKPVAFISYGGVSGGLRAVEHLRLVFAELHATTIRDSVALANPWKQFGADGQGPPGADEAMTIMLSRLSWWALALRNARSAHAYAMAAA